MSLIRLAARNLARPRLAFAAPRIQNSVPWRAGFSSPAGLTKDDIQKRVIDVLKGFEKVNPSKVLSANFLTRFVRAHTPRSS
jgi:NADH dehydrogenase (ubiquinone) 1 alpha/beta subcomplex 1, acyl-carrier protein